MAESDACPNQAFILGKAIGLQFHLESNPESMKRLIDHCAEEMTAGPYVQMPEDLAAAQESYDGLRVLMEGLLDRIERELGD